LDFAGWRLLNASFAGSKSESYDVQRGTGRIVPPYTIR